MRGSFRAVSVSSPNWKDIHSIRGTRKRTELLAHPARRLELAGYARAPRRACPERATPVRSSARDDTLSHRSCRKLRPRKRSILTQTLHLPLRTQVVSQRSHIADHRSTQGPNAPLPTTPPATPPPYLPASRFPRAARSSRPPGARNLRSGRLALWARSRSIRWSTRT